MSLFDNLRVQYGDRGLRRRDLPVEPIELLRTWLDAATAAGVTEANAMALATVDGDGLPACRMVLLKGLDDGTLSFFSNYDSDKGVELARNPHAALTFWWRLPAARQVRVLGSVARLGQLASAAYFRSRPFDSQVAAAASPQSRTVASREHLEAMFAAVRQSAEQQPLECPPSWGGYVVTPQRFEFWQGRDHRLHDRFRYQRVQGRWEISRLAP